MPAIESLEGHNVELIIDEGNKHIHLDSMGHFILGRTSKDSNVGGPGDSKGGQVDVDLSPYSAYENFVSRRHAIIDIRTDQVLVIDLGSANGTRLNGKLLPPHKPHSVADRDVLTLGKLKITILISGTFYRSEP